MKKCKILLNLFLITGAIHAMHPEDPATRGGGHVRRPSTPFAPILSRGGCSNALFTALEELNAINLQLANRPSCAATPISQANFVTNQYNIVKPGNYCLTENCTGKINIIVSNVTLDLNSFNIISTAASQPAIRIAGNYVTVKNGSASTPASTGHTEYPQGVIRVFDSNYCTLQDLTINFCGTECTRSTEEHNSMIRKPVNYGMLLIDSSNNVIVERVVAYSNTNANVSLQALSTTNLFVLDSIFDSAQSVIGLNGACFNILVSGCSFRNAVDGAGLKCVGCRNLSITNSNALDNGAAGFAIYTETINFEIINCNVISNDFDGITVDRTCNYGTIDSCNALSNVGNGFNVSGAGSSIIVQNCDANNNAAFGFLSGTASVRFWNNAAINNNNGGGDYNIASGDPVLAIGDPNFAAGYNVAGVA